MRHRARDSPPSVALACAYAVDASRRPRVRRDVGGHRAHPRQRVRPAALAHRHRARRCVGSTRAATVTTSRRTRGSRALRQRNLRARAVVRVHVRRRRRLRVLLHVPRRAGQGAARRPVVGDDVAATPAAAGRRRAMRPRRRSRASGRTIRVPGRRRDHPGRPSTAPRPATWCSCRRASTTRASRSRPTGIVLRGRRPQPHHPRRRVHARERREGRRRRRRRDREPHRPQLHRERVLLDRRARATAASYLTAYRNGDYGIYAFDSQWGQFDHSYASGSPDAGFYIGQCNPCHAVITDVVAEYNQLGYSGTNSSGDLFIVQLGRGATTAPASCRTASTASCCHHRAMPSSPATGSATTGAPTPRPATKGFDIALRRRDRDHRRRGRHRDAEPVDEQQRSSASGSRRRPASAGSFYQSTGNQVRTTRLRLRPRRSRRSSRATPTTRTASRTTRSRRRRRRTSSG